MGVDAYIEFRLSGGGANTDPAASIGGAISSTPLVYQTLPASTLTAITYLGAGGCPTGNVGYLQYGYPTGMMEFSTTNGAPYGGEVDITVDGDYLILNANGTGWIKVRKSGGLAANDSHSSISITDSSQNLFDNVLSTEAADGDVEYRCIYLKNAHGSTAITGASMWVETQTNPAITIQLGLDPGGKNTTPSAIANESTAPAGVTFATYDSIFNDLLIGNLSAGDYYPVWVRRTLAAEAGSSGTDKVVFGVKFV